MSNNVLDQFHQQEAEKIALSVQFNQWSLVMIEVMIGETEKKLSDSNLPVDGDDKPDYFWREMQEPATR
jgi:hypothetical protein